MMSGYPIGNPLKKPSIKMILTNACDPDVRVYKEALYLVEHGCDVEILCWDRACQCADNTNEVLDGIKITRFEIASIAGSGFKQIPAYFKYVSACAKYLKWHAFDYLHCHDLDGMIAGYLAASKNGSPKFVFDMHEWWETKNKRNYRLRYLIRTCINFLQSRCAAVIYVDTTQREHIKKSNLDKYHYLPNYPAGNLFLDGAKSSCSKLRFAYIGCVRSTRGMYERFFSAASQLPEADFFIHGGGSSIQIALDTAKPYNNVFVTGPFNGVIDSERLYMDTDVLCCIYDQTFAESDDNFCVKFFEALATCTPIIVNANTRMADFVLKHSIGFCVNTDNIADIAKTVKHIILNPHELDIAKDNIRNIRDQYKWETVVSVLSQIYRGGAK